MVSGRRALATSERVRRAGGSSPCFDFFAYLVVIRVCSCGEGEVHTRLPILSGAHRFGEPWCLVLSNDLFNGFTVIEGFTTRWHTISPAFGDVIKRRPMNHSQPCEHVVRKRCHINAGHEYAPSRSRFLRSACHVNASG